MAIKVCDCCGQALPDAYSEVAERYGLSRSMTAVFLAVAAGNGRLVTFEHLVDAIYGDDPNGGADTAMGCLRAFVMKGNTRLSGSGLRMESVFGQGYRLSRDAESASTQAVA